MAGSGGTAHLYKAQHGANRLYYWFIGPVGLPVGRFVPAIATKTSKRPMKMISAIFIGRGHWPGVGCDQR